MRLFEVVLSETEDRRDALVLYRWQIAAVSLESALTKAKRLQSNLSYTQPTNITEIKDKGALL